MRGLFSAFAILFGCVLYVATANAEEFKYSGSWETVKNIRLNGTMLADVVSTGKEQWTGRFSGVWQGQDFSYDVKFTGPANALKGSCRIDGADYEWTGKIDTEKFRGTFTGSRYTGSFNLSRKK